MKTNQFNKEIVKAISKMSHNLGIRVLGEGVEDEHAICLGLKSTINLLQAVEVRKRSSIGFKILYIVCFALQTYSKR